MAYLPEHWTWHTEPIGPGRAVVVDIDGVLSDARTRQHYLESPRQDWRSFFDACGEDPVIEEVQALDKGVVLLTISIAGGPFIGLLGTVLGVMITFASIALAGDVNVNAIAPGIAAALLATVTGLAVAIPALFGYNYISTQNSDVVAKTQIFGDRLITRFAELQRRHLKLAAEVV